MVTAFFPLFVKAVGATLIVALGASVIGFSAGLAIGVMTAKKMRTLLLSPLLDAYVLMVRGTPAYVQLLIVYYVLPEVTGINLTPTIAGIIALGLNEAAYCAEIVRGGIDALPSGQWEASKVLGYSTFITLKDIIVPQMMRAVLPALANDLATLIKDTSLVSVIGLIEITQVGKNVVALTLKPLEVYALVAGIYLAITTTVTMSTKLIAKRINHG